MFIAIGSDHAGYAVKKEIIKRFDSESYQWLDCGAYNNESVDYPDIAESVAAKVLQQGIPGVVICGTGIGISIAANKISGIRAALCHTVYAARMAREHNNANIIAIGARTTAIDLACEMINIFINSIFQGGRHQKRIEKIEYLEKKISKGVEEVDYITRYVQPVDPELAETILNEEKRQNNKLELIASENFVSRAVMAAQGSVMTNKYAEGYPGKRYYGGCEFVDAAEELARERAKKLFSAGHANVQPHSGAQANMAVYFAALQPGDTVLGMDLSHGGHLTHGSPVNISGKYFNFVAYGVEPESELINYDQVREIALKTRPRMIVAGASAYPRTIDFKKFREMADEVGAYLFVDMAHIAGLVAAGKHPSPVPYAHFVTSTTHKTLRGPRGGLILCNSDEWAKKIDSAIFPGIQGGPLMHVIAAKAVCFLEALKDEFKEYQQNIIDNAQALASALSENGLRLVSQGTDNHLMLVDVRPKSLTGKRAEAILESVNITVNKNTIPFDTQTPFVTSGIRLGTPALTSRGMDKADMRLIGKAIAEALSSPENDQVLEEVRESVKNLCEKYPLY